MWKNKHVVVAMLVAPVLAILAWFAVDWFVGERPHVAESGRDYPLVARSNCRWASGKCELVNEEFRLELREDEGGDGLALLISSRYPLSDATVGLSPREGVGSRPVSFTPTDESGRHWAGNLPTVTGEGATLQLVVGAGGSRYYAEVPTVFLDDE